MAVGVCAYCGETKPLTVDHVPPKLMLEEPYPDNLVTVPACLDCNKKFQKNDEYTRTVIALDFRAAGNPAARSRLPKIFRSRAYPQAKGFSDYLKRQLKATELVDGTGKPLGIRAEVDQSRIDSTGERFARGLYFYLVREPLPRDSQVWVYSKPGYNSIDFIVPNFNTILEKCGDLYARSDRFGFQLCRRPERRWCVFGFLLFEDFWWIVAILDAGVKIPGLTSDK